MLTLSLLVPLAATAAALGAAAYATIAFLRAFRFIERRLFMGHRPWACDLCMSFWTVLLWTGALELGGLAAPLPAATGPGHAVLLGLRFALALTACLLLLGWVSSLPPADPPVLPGGGGDPLR